MLVEFETFDGHRILVNPAQVKAVQHADGNLVGTFAIIMEYFPMVSPTGEVRMFQHAIQVKGETFSTMRAKLGGVFEVPKIDFGPTMTRVES